MSEEGFLSRWSQRKRAALRGEAPPEPGVEMPIVETPAPEAAASPPEEPPFDPASLPPVESLTAESDFLPFLARNVPALLKRAALRRMWSLDIAIRDYVGPADYAWDYNAVDGVPGSSLDLIGDIQKYLAQAIGAAPAPEPDTPEAPPPEAIAEAPLPEPLRLSEAAPAPIPAAPAEASEPGPRPRRHGAAAPG
ncbi:MAG: DUF3306 domain-containing protein [Pseudomonadota bacterium]